MKIQRDHDLQVNRSHLKSSPPKNQKTPASESKKPAERDTVESSSRSEEIRRLMELIELVPDVRSEKINAIKKQIEAGTYNVSADSVARSIAALQKKLKRGNR